MNNITEQHNFMLKQRGCFTPFQKCQIIWKTLWNKHSYSSVASQPLSHYVGTNNKITQSHRAVLPSSKKIIASICLYICHVLLRVRLCLHVFWFPFNFDSLFFPCVVAIFASSLCFSRLCNYHCVSHLCLVSPLPRMCLCFPFPSWVLSFVHDRECFWPLSFCLVSLDTIAWLWLPYRVLILFCIKWPEPFGRLSLLCWVFPARTFITFSSKE